MPAKMEMTGERFALANSGAGVDSVCLHLPCTKCRTVWRSGGWEQDEKFG